VFFVRLLKDESRSDEIPELHIIYFAKHCYIFIISRGLYHELSWKIIRLSGLPPQRILSGVRPKFSDAFPSGQKRKKVSFSVAYTMDPLRVYRKEDRKYAGNTALLR
jgi:hypothetical protein